MFETLDLFEKIRSDLNTSPLNDQSIESVDDLHRYFSDPNHLTAILQFIIDKFSSNLKQRLDMESESGFAGIKYTYLFSRVRGHDLDRIFSRVFQLNCTFLEKIYFDPEFNSKFLLPLELEEIMDKINEIKK